MTDMVDQVVGVARLVRHERALWRRGSHGVIALGTGAEEPVLITGAGAVVWDLLESPLSPEELSRLLGEVHGRASAIVLEEITPFVEELLNLGVLATCP